MQSQRLRPSTQPESGLMCSMWTQQQNPTVRWTDAATWPGVYHLLLPVRSVCVYAVSPIFPVANLQTLGSEALPHYPAEANEELSQHLSKATTTLQLFHLLLVMLITLLSLLLYSIDIAWFVVEGYTTSRSAVVAVGCSALPMLLGVGSHSLSIVSTVDASTECCEKCMSDSACVGHISSWICIVKYSTQLTPDLSKVPPS
jgi:hypothetical protein